VPAAASRAVVGGLAVGQASAAEADRGGRDHENGTAIAAATRKARSKTTVGAIGDHRPDNGAQHREPDGAARLTSGVEQAGGRPGVRLWDAGQADQRLSAVMCVGAAR
jgi:hypothetical protein